MILKSSAVCLTLLLAYSILLPLEPQLSALQAQWQQNLHKAEEYLYADTSARSVIIGTSLSERLVTAQIPDCDNLSFSGLSIFEGLSLLRYKDRLPETVYIEENVLLRTQNRNFSAALLSPVPLLLRRRLVALRADKEPLALLGQRLGDTIRAGEWHIKDKLVRHAEAAPETHPAPADTPQLDDRMLAPQIKDYSETPSEALLNSQLQLLTSDVSYLTSKGVRVAFFEMPVNPRLMSLPKAQLVRSAIHKMFPPARFHYIELPPDSASYVTRDGVHLTSKEAARYTSYFVDQAKALNSSN